MEISLSSLALWLLRAMYDHVTGPFGVWHRNDQESMFTRASTGSDIDGECSCRRVRGYSWYPDTSILAHPADVTHRVELLQSALTAQIAGQVVNTPPATK